MKCITTIEAERIAAYGAAKMNDEGYSFRASQYGATTYEVSKPGQETPYYTSPASKSCTCPFFWDNVIHGTCKHIQYVANELKAEAERDERAAMLADFDNASEWEVENIY